MAAATLFILYASVVADDLLKLPALRKFIEENLASTDWHSVKLLYWHSVRFWRTSSWSSRALALNTFPALFRFIRGFSPFARDTNMWALGRVCELHPGSFPLEHSGTIALLFAAGWNSPRVLLLLPALGFASFDQKNRVGGTHGPVEERVAHEMLARILPQLSMLWWKPLNVKMLTTLLWDQLLWSFDWNFSWSPRSDWIKISFKGSLITSFHFGLIDPTCCWGPECRWTSSWLRIFNPVVLDYLLRQLNVPG